jgi:hypothetical protein
LQRSLDETHVWLFPVGPATVRLVRPIEIAEVVTAAISKIVCRLPRRWRGSGTAARWSRRSATLLTAAAGSSGTSSVRTCGVPKQGSTSLTLCVPKTTSMQVKTYGDTRGGLSREDQLGTESGRGRDPGRLELLAEHRVRVH